MVELHPIVKKELSKVVTQYDQEHIETQLRNLFENVLTNNYDDTDIVLLIENVRLTDTEIEEGDQE